MGEASPEKPHYMTPRTGNVRHGQVQTQWVLVSGGLGLGPWEMPSDRLWPQESLEG